MPKRNQPRIALVTSLLLIIFGSRVSQVWGEGCSVLSQSTLTGYYHSFPACDTPLTLNGPEAVSKPGTHQYSASGGDELAWSVSGQGATIEPTGLVTLDSTACGSFVVTVSGCGYIETKNVRISNAGKWDQGILTGHAPAGWCGIFNCIEGTKWYWEYWAEVDIQHPENSPWQAINSPHHCQDQNNIYRWEGHPCRLVGQKVFTWICN